MYQPAHHREDRLEEQHALIRAHPLGLLVSHGPAGLLADPVPFVLDDRASPLGTLRAHLARANPHWRALEVAAEVLVVFQGAQAYVTPSWYPSKREHGRVVPTWNYVMVQVRGRVVVHDDPTWIAAQVEELTRQQERPRAAPWSVSDAPDPFIAAQMRGIVGLAIEIAGIEGKWKVSQNRPVADRAGVTAGLQESGDDTAAAMAALVRDRG